MSWVYVPGLVVSNSESRSPSLQQDLFVSSNGKHTRKPPSWRGWSKRPWIRLLSGAMLPLSVVDHGAGEWISSVRGSLVSRSRSQGPKRDSMTTDGFGQMSFGFCENVEHGASSLRMSRGSESTDYQRSSETLPVWGGMRNGVCFPLKPWEPPMSVGGCSFWPSPTASDANASGSAGYSTETGRHSGVTLTDAPLRLWPTPTAQEYGNNQGGSAGRVGPVRLSLEGCSRLVATLHCGQECRRQLNPLFVEALMGLPPRWSIAETGSGLSETEWSRWWRRMRSALSQLG